jgi:hypothetical protein
MKINDEKNKDTAASTPAYKQEIAALTEENQSLKNRIAWFEKQLFGQRSEKRILDNPLQSELQLGSQASVASEANSTKKIEGYERGKAKKQRPDDCVTDTGLRFGEDVPVEIIELTPQELKGKQAGEYEIVDTKISRKLAKQPASYVVLEYQVPVVRHKASGDLQTTAMPEQVLEGSIADVSLIVGLLVDKFLYHLPLHRQHQQLAHAGIQVARSSLTNWTQRAIELLRPIVQAQLEHVLQSKVLAMDETPIKSGRKHKGKMKQAWFWPLYGEYHEVVFTYSESRGKQHIVDTLNNEFSGTLVTDGYAAYARYAETTAGLSHAQCWVHSRRYLVDARDSSPAEIDSVLDIIGELYQIEKSIKQQGLAGEKKRAYRLEYSKPEVDKVFAWIEQQCQRPELTPKHPLTKALNYLRPRETQLRVYLEDPDVPMDTNHLEREIRPIPLGKKNWLFCWTELGAEHVGIIQSLISTCKLHEINPHTYLTDVLQRVSQHPASKVEELTPRLWKGKFAKEPLRSVLYKAVN